MKKCKVHCTVNDLEADGIIVDNYVYVPSIRLDDIEPAFISGDVCYYPPYDATDFAKKMEYDLVPFSTECKWNDFGNPIPEWAYGCDDVEDEKWGYCNAKTGKIRMTPQWMKCFNFTQHGMAVVDGIRDGVIYCTGEEILPCEYDYMKRV